MKALLIDPIAREVRSVDIATWRDISPALGCELFDVIRLTPSESLFVDDEGLYQYPNPRGYFAVCGRTIAGSGLILGNTPDGESIDTRLTPQWLLKHAIEWLDTPAAEDVEPRMEIVAWEDS